MFQPKYDWIEDYIKSYINMGRPLTAGAFEECLKLLKEKDEKIQELRYELKKFKPRKNKVKNARST